MARILAIVAALTVVALLTACHDEIPVQRDSSSTSIVSATSAQPESVSVESQGMPIQASGQFLFYGATEDGSGQRYMFVTYWPNIDGPPLAGSSLSLKCSVGRQIWIENLPWLGQERVTLLFSLDNQPPQAEQVQLQRYVHYPPEGREHMAFVQLDDATWYERLRSAQTLTIELVDSELSLLPVSFDLIRLLGTPLQDDIENCGESSVSDSGR